MQKGRESGAHAWIFWSRETRRGRSPGLRGSAQGCSFPHPACQSQQRDALRGGGPHGLTGDPRFPGPPGPAAAEGPLALVSILHSFRKAARTSIKRSSDASTTETGRSSRGRRGLRARLAHRDRGRPHTQSPSACRALMQTPHPLQSNYRFGGLRDVGGRAPHSHGDGAAGSF